jgi:diadenosine tetraphosphate (Ap4A) HIT family hydrolase
MNSECKLCANNETAEIDLPPRERVLMDDHWRVVVNRSSLPGWLLVICRRHIESLSELTSAEEAAIGPILADGTRALGDVVGCVKSYVMLFAEGTKHLHFSLVPRMADIPEHLKGAGVSGYHTEAPVLSEPELDELAEKLNLTWTSRA